MVFSNIVAVIGAATGVGGLVLAGLAYRASMVSNRIAESANKTARESIEVAREANNVAVKANDLSEDANSISRQALVAATDNLKYKWLVKVDDDASTAVVVNNSPHDAVDVTVVVKHDGALVTQKRADSVSGFGELTLNIKGILSEHFNKVHNNPSFDTESGDDVYSNPRPGPTVTTLVDFHVSWQTPSGVSRDDIINHPLCHGDNYGKIELRECPES